MCRKYY